jgi:hypothetical protein
MTRDVPGAIIVGTLIVLSLGAMGEELPVPPIPPDHAPFGDIAPVPNPDARAPVRPASGSPSVDVHFYHYRRYDPALGFAPGSQYQTNEDRKPIDPPGLSINVPLR